MKPELKPHERIIVALDTNELSEATNLVDMLWDKIGMLKIGLQLLTAVGALDIIYELKKSMGNKPRIFLDGKFCDIPNTVGKASAAAASLGADMFNVHASCGLEAMKAAVANKGDAKVLAVTLLTSIGTEECRRIYGVSPIRVVEGFVRDAMACGIDGIICSPKEVQFVSRITDMITVVPGIRPSWAAANDQKRITTPRDAILAGADYLVIGRPITSPPEGVGGPVGAAELIVGEIEAALADMDESREETDDR